MLDTEKEWYIEAPWGRICILAWGSCADPPVLLCHGAVDSAVSWRPILERMPSSFYYIGIDLPGNGKSDPLPKGLMLATHDLVYALEVVRRHFRWEHFVYMAHSLGTALGKQYNLAYPGRMSKVVDFDPTPAYYTVTPDQFGMWYHEYFTKYYKKYHIYNAPKETAPIYTRDKALSMLKRNRNLTGPAASMVLDRISEPLGEGRIRYTFDQRIKQVVTPPFTPEHARKFYTEIKTPTLTIIASDSLKRGCYSSVPFALDQKAHPHNNYRVFHVEGGHNVHVMQPEKMAAVVKEFLLHGVEGVDRKSKL